MGHVNTYNKFIEAIKNDVNIKELQESPILRTTDDVSYFTFSPFQDTQDNFTDFSKSKALYVKKQRTIRKIDSLDLTNPLNMNYQITYAVQNYNRGYQLPIIEDLLEKVRLQFYPYISEKSIVITYPDVLQGYFDRLNKNYKLNEVPLTERYISKLGLQGSHYYIKVRMNFKNGAINVVDFVLVNYNATDFSSQLDSIWVEDLIDLLNENKSYIFDEDKYRAIKEIVNPYTSSHRDQHIILNDLRVIFKILELGVLPGAKGINSELRRKIRRLFFYFYFYVSKSNEELLSIISTFGTQEKIKRKYIDIFLDEISKAQKNYVKSVKLVKKNKINRKKAQESYGIPDEFYGDYLENYKSEYNF